MFFKNFKTQPLFLLGFIVFLSGCIKDKNSTNASKKPKSLSHNHGQNKKNLQAKNQPNLKSKTSKSTFKKECPKPEAKLLVESEVIYNYCPKDFLDDTFESSYLENLALSGSQAYQLKTASGSHLTELASIELENLALAWEKNQDKADKALELWAQSDDQILDYQDLKPVYFKLSKSTIDPEQEENIDFNFSIVKKMVDDGHRIIIKGHADPAEASNESFTLAFNRAQAVKNKLIDKGAKPHMLQIVAVGADEPISWHNHIDNNEDLEQNNCRAELLVA